MIGWIVETLVASTLLMLLVLLVRGPVARLFGPRIAYGLWLLPALRMVLPPLPADVAPAPLAALPDVVHAQALLAAASALGDPLPAMGGAEAAIDGPSLLLALWIAGAAIFFVGHLISYRRFVRRTLADATQLPRLDRDGIEVCASPYAGGPFAAGIFLKAIVLPLDWRHRYEADELRLALDHEAAHHRRCDMSANLVALGVLALHWWNPIAHRAHRAFRVDQELACDAVVLAGATPAERHAYGSALLKSACDRLPVAACALGAGEDLKRRLRTMASYRADGRRTRIGALIATALVGSGLLLTASGGIAAETTKSVEKKVRFVLLRSPAPARPAAAAAPAAPPAAPAAPDAPSATKAPAPPPAPAAPEVTAFRFEHDDAGMHPDAISAEAMAEARHAAAEALAEVNRIDLHRLALTELRSEMPNIRAEIAHARAEAAKAHGERRHFAMRSCAKGKAMVMSSDAAGHRMTLVRCGHESSAADQAEMRAQMIESLEEARSNLVRNLDDDWARKARESAVAAIDRKLEELRTHK
jgi:beta-lactamase regulating signal transducer with metallopeptidase domain